MQIILIALLYATPTSEPSVQVHDFVYDNMQECYQDSDFARALLMEGAPYSDSWVDTYCVALPVGA
jgi:hypothetical protein